MFAKLIQYIKDSKTELRKVTWPTKEQTVKHTVLVICFSLAVAIFLGVLDYFFDLGLKKSL